MTENDDATVQLLRETLRERSEQVDPGSPLRAAAPGSRRGAFARPALVAAAAAGVLALAVGSVAAWRDRSPTAASHPAPAATRTTVATVPPSGVPAGWKPVASLGVQIWVPPQWSVTGAVNGCDRPGPGGGLVSRPIGAVVAMRCPATLVGGSVVVFGRGLSTGATPGRTDHGKRTTITWVSPDRLVSVVASGPDPAVLQRVADSARPVDVDALGCATQLAQADWDRRRDGLPAVRLDRGVTDVVVCVYARPPGAPDHRMVASGRLTRGEREALAAALGRAPAGAAPDLAQDCASSAHGDEYAVLRLGSGGGVRELALHWDGCANRYVATAEGQSVTTIAVVGAVLDPLGVTFGHADGLPKG